MNSRTSRIALAFVLASYLLGIVPSTDLLLASQSPSRGLLVPLDLEQGVADIRIEAMS